MSKLHLPSKPTKRQQAFERIIAQFLFKLNLKFPKEITEKEALLSYLIEKCKEEGFVYKFQCRWGLIKQPVSFLEGLIEVDWTIDGVQEFLKFYHNRRTVNRAHNKRRAEKWFKGIKTPSKKETWEIGKNIERELNEYGKKWDIESYLIEIVTWTEDSYTMKIEIGPFVEWFSWDGTKDELLSYLKDLVKECLNHHEEMKEYWEERKEIREKMER